MATPTIPNGETQFFVSKYEGNGTGQRIGKFVPFDDSSGGTIANSCIFNTSDSPDLNRTITTGSQRRIFTISFWVKLGAGGGTLGTNIFYECRQPSNSENFYFGLMDNGKIAFQALNSSGNHVLTQHSNRTFKDTTKWYHFMAAVDTTQATTTDRLKMYVDGDQITSFSYSNYDGGQNYDLPFGNDNSTMYIGQASASSYYMNGYLAEFNIIDGQALLPASFGVTDTSTGRWIPAQVKPHPTTTTTYTVTVVGGNPSNHPYYNVGSTNKFAINGSTATADVDLTLYEGATYRFDQSDSSNSGHPLRFSTVAHGTHASGGTEYTTNVTVVGTAGTSGAYTEITVASSAPDLHYYCSSHNGMGYQASTPIGYGANGARFTFSDSSSLGADTSGNSNTFTVTNLASTDQTTDSPTQNFATGLGAFQTSYPMTLSEGNLKSEANGGTNQFGKSQTTLSFDPNDSDGYYAEYTVNGTASVGSNFNTVGIGGESSKYVVPNSSNGAFNLMVAYFEDGRVRFTNEAGTSTDIASWGSTWGNVSTPDIIGIFVKNNKIYFHKNGTYQNSADPNNETGGLDIEGTIGSNRVGFFHVGYDTSVHGTMTANFGQKSFTYTPPTGYKKLNQDNLPETVKGITGMSWTKDRDSGSYNHELYDSSRGAFQELRTNATTAENTRPQALSKFLKGGFAVGDRTGMNSAGNSYVSWNWVANGGVTSSNGDGATASTVQANTTAGFSIVEYTGTGGATSVGHGLSAAPEWMLFKDKGNSTNWRVYHTSMGGITKYMLLNSSAAVATASMWGSPTASAFIVGGTGYEVNESGNNYIAYCWHGVDGFSKFGKYIGNGSTDGTFVYTGFKPACVIVKNASSAYRWNIIDNVRDPINPAGKWLTPNDTSVESNYNTSYPHDFLSNGFKLRANTTVMNRSGDTYIFMAFAEHPFVGDGTSPVTAR